MSLLVGETPFKRPFKWSETYYHELSHGLACLLTLGKVNGIRLNFDGSGLCTTQGGSRIVILLMGYAGASLWGGALYMAGWALGDSGSAVWLQVELALLAVTVVLWVRDIKTLLILTVVGGVYAGALLYAEQRVLHILLQYMGIYVMMNAIRAPLYLIDGQHVGDGAALADIFKIIPEIVWIFLWFALACGVLLACGYVTVPEIRDFVNVQLV